MQEPLLPQLSEIWLYPIKSLPGISVKQATVETGGLRYDRRYMLVDNKGHFITQRDEAQLGSFTSIISSGQLVVSSQSGQTLAVELAPNYLMPAELQGARKIRVSVWRDQPEALIHAKGSAFFTAALKREVKLVYLPKANLRQIAGRQTQDCVSFADGYPYLLTSTASLEALNQQAIRLSQEHDKVEMAPLSMRRFRPNLVISGLAAWKEEEFLELSVGEVLFLMPKLCERCVVTSIEPETLKKTPEPLRSLAAFHRWSGAVWFGANLLHQNEGKLELGAKLCILKAQVSPRPVS